MFRKLFIPIFALMVCGNSPFAIAQYEHPRMPRMGYNHHERRGFRELYSDSGFALTEIFTSECFTFEDIILPYRKVVTGQVSERNKGALILYLHGSSRRGDDNMRQLTEVGILNIYNYLSKNGINATILVPQCPPHLSWGRSIDDTLKSAIKAMIDANFSTVDPSRVYAFGTSMGAAGVWSLISTYSGLFAAAMPVSASPSKAIVENVLPTCIYAVIGSEDTMADVEYAERFVSAIKSAGGTVVLDIEEELDHHSTSIGSYTDIRLEWIFSKSKCVN